MSDLFEAQHGEEFKCGVHLALFGLTVACGLYALGAMQCRPDRHLRVNAAIYGALAIFEWRQMLRHREAL